ncbi:MAG: zinc-ribbon domain-containing protein [Muribaculaceae bacterium]|jgi:ribosomal protein L40E|nr:zinc-ribbon domain-containing protein [Muribaculaceae bacterium]
MDENNSTERRICKKCGSELTVGAKYCGECGAVWIAPDERVCWKCGATLRSGAKFCHACGTEWAEEHICRNCGAEIPLGVKCCGQCGKEWFPEYKVPKVNQKCPKCGVEITEDMAFCDNCGAKMPVAVDLGLSVKWASCNVGATSPTECGRYFGWADPTGTKTSKNFDDYPSATPPWGISRTKYDMARVNWGGDWRLPTEKECQELVDKCKWEWTGKGMKVTGPNGNSIFLPAAGHRYGTDMCDVGTLGNYWSGSLNECGAIGAYDLGFSRSGNHYVGSDGRGNGFSVRPVVE